MVNWQRGVLKAMHIVNHPVTVIAVDDRTNWYRRITFAAPELVGEIEPFPTFWLRLWVPNPARGHSHLSQRGYTFVTIDPHTGSFTLDFVLHEAQGPAGDWAKQVAVGDTLEVALTPARVKVPDDTAHLVLAGDVTALPAINTWIEQTPADVHVQVFLEDGHDDVSELPSADRPGLEWTWISPAEQRGSALAERLAASVSATDGTYVWVAGERMLVKNVRPVIKHQLALDRSRHFSQTYWIEGRSAS